MPRNCAIASVKVAGRWRKKTSGGLQKENLKPKCGWLWATFQNVDIDRDRESEKRRRTIAHAVIMLFELCFSNWALAALAHEAGSRQEGGRGLWSLIEPWSYLTNQRGWRTNTQTKKGKIMNHRAAEWHPVGHEHAKQPGRQRGKAAKGSERGERGRWPIRGVGSARRVWIIVKPVAKTQRGRPDWNCSRAEPEGRSRQMKLSCCLTGIKSLVCASVYVCVCVSAFCTFQLKLPFANCHPVIIATTPQVWR